MQYDEHITAYRRHSFLEWLSDKGEKIRKLKNQKLSFPENGITISEVTLKEFNIPFKSLFQTDWIFSVLPDEVILSEQKLNTADIFDKSSFKDFSDLTYPELPETSAVTSYKVDKSIFKDIFVSPELPETSAVTSYKVGKGIFKDIFVSPELPETSVVISYKVGKGIFNDILVSPELPKLSVVVPHQNKQNIKDMFKSIIDTPDINIEKPLDFKITPPAVSAEIPSVKIESFNLPDNPRLTFTFQNIPSIPNKLNVSDISGIVDKSVFFDVKTCNVEISPPLKNFIIFMDKDFMKSVISEPDITIKPFSLPVPESDTSVFKDIKGISLPETDFSDILITLPQKGEKMLS